MKILSVTAQKPDSTGSGIYLTELVRGFKKKGITQSVIAGVTKADQVCLPEGVSFYPVYFESEQLPYPITGMSDEMPYPSTRYSDLTEEMTETFRNAFGEVLKKAVEELDPDVILCHHLYLLTAIVRELFPDKKGIWSIPWIRPAADPQDRTEPGIHFTENSCAGWDFCIA